MKELKSELLYELHLELGQSQAIKTPDGLRAVVPITGGWMKSPKFTVTEIMPNAGDWLHIRQDGVTELDVRLVMRLDDEALCYMTYGGLHFIPQSIRERISKGEDVDPGEYYFRATPRFQTGSETYAWLNKVVCVANGKIAAFGKVVEYVGFQIL